MFGVCLMDASESFHTLHICMCMSLGRGKYVCVANWNWMHIHYYVDQARGTKSLFVCVFMWCMHEGFHTLHTTTHHHHGVCHRPTETCKLALWNGRLLFFFARTAYLSMCMCAHTIRMMAQSRSLSTQPHHTTIIVHTRGAHTQSTTRVSLYVCQWLCIWRGKNFSALLTSSPTSSVPFRPYAEMYTQEDIQQPGIATTTTTVQFSMDWCRASITQTHTLTHHQQHEQEKLFRDAAVAKVIARRSAV